MKGADRKKNEPHPVRRCRTGTFSDNGKGIPAELRGKPV